jgi:hypothetical protein
MGGDHTDEHATPASTPCPWAVVEEIRVALNQLHSYDQSLVPELLRQGHQVGNRGDR